MKTEQKGGEVKYEQEKNREKGSVLEEVKVTSLQKEKTHQNAIGSTGFPARLYDFLLSN